MAGREEPLRLEKGEDNRAQHMIGDLLQKDHRPKDHHPDIKGKDTKTDIERGQEGNMIIHHPNSKDTRVGQGGSTLQKVSAAIKECKEKIHACKGVINKDIKMNDKDPILKEENPLIRGGGQGRVRLLVTGREEGRKNKLVIPDTRSLEEITAPTAKARCLPILITASFAGGAGPSRKEEHLVMKTPGGVILQGKDRIINGIPKEGTPLMDGKDVSRIKWVEEDLKGEGGENP